MIFIYFLYGLSLFTLGISLLFYPKEGSRFILARTLSFIAFFGIFHGANEWINMFSLMQKPSEIIILKIIGLIILPVSYLFLVLFGTMSLSMISKKYSSLKALPIILFLLWAIITAASGQHFLTGDIFARYLLGVPGIFLTSYVFLKQMPIFRKKIPSIITSLKIAAGAFFFYGIFSSLIVPEAGFFPASIINDTVFMNKFGMPVQVFRAFCAIAVCYSTLAILRMFDWENKEMRTLSITDELTGLLNRRGFFNLSEQLQVFRAYCAIAVCYSTLAILRIFDWENKEMRTLSITDELTGLLNRRGFFNLAEQQFKLAKRLKKETLLISADIDNLKEINDTFGHKEGDLALIDTANVIRKSFRESDIIARIGGDEFVVYQIENIDSDSNILTARVQKYIELHNTKENRNYKLSISVGAMRNEPQIAYSIEELLIKADQLMYKHKRSKQNS